MSRTPEENREYQRNWRRAHREEINAKERERYWANREKEAERKHKARLEDPEKFRVRYKEYRLRNREKERERCRLKQRRAREKDPEKIRAGVRDWKKRHPDNLRNWFAKHPEKMAEYNNRRRARKLNAAGDYTVEEWLELCGLYDYRCLCCGKREKLTPDHIIPLAKGGTNNIDNIQPLCGPCNSRKSIRVVDYRQNRAWGVGEEAEVPVPVDPVP